jgi:hypothetical protein
MLGNIGEAKQALADYAVASSGGSKQVILDF